jgi:nuclear pore complex protein Nup107
MSKEKLISLVRNMWELECLVRALDSIETLASVAGLSREYVYCHEHLFVLLLFRWLTLLNNRGETNTSREMWQHTVKEIRMAKACMEPVIKGWLLGDNPGMKQFMTPKRASYANYYSLEPKDEDFKLLRQAYLPETVLAYISCLQFVGTSLSRDYLLECMDLAAKIAEKDSDVAKEFMRCGRMKELVESLASCSKALAVYAHEKKGQAVSSSSKKMREMGWSRELWTVKP